MTSPHPPPHDAAAEVALIGSCLLDPSCLDGPASKIQPEDFYLPRHAALWGLMAEVRLAGKPLDAVALPREAEARGLVEAIGGRHAVAEALGAVMSPAHADHYAGVVADRSLARKVRDAALRALSAAESGAPGEDCLRTAQDGLGGILTSGTTKGPSDLSEAVYAVLERLEGEQQSEAALPTGYPTLDDVMAGGLHPGELVVVGARPSVGKSTLASNVVANAATARPEAGIYVASLEMTLLDVARNMIAARGRVRGDGLRKGGRYLTDRDRERVSVAAAELVGMKVSINDDSAATVATIRRDARRLQARWGRLDLIVVDYLQLMEGRGDTRQDEVAKMSRGLKVLAKDMAVPVLALSQLNRQAEGRDGQRPRLSDLRESGSIEQDADVVLLMHRPWMQSRLDSERNEATIIVAKNRHGPLEDVRLRYDPEWLLFSTPSIDGR